jgi:Ca-activated chloride channel family protein
MIESSDAFHFLRPAWLWCSVPALLLAAAAVAQRGSGGQLVAGGGTGAPGTSARRRQAAPRRNVVAAIVAWWLLATLAAAGPSWQQLPQPVLQKQDALVVVVDLSYSMLATDLAPSRNDRVRRKLRPAQRPRARG